DPTTSMLYEGLAILDSRHNYDLALSLSRLGMLPFFWVACGVVYWWSRRMGGASAVIAVLLFSFLPPVLAHAGLATTDMALTACTGLTSLGGLLWPESPTLKSPAIFGSAAALATLSKFSFLVFFPAAAAVALAWYWWRARPGSRDLLSSIRHRLPTFALAVF